MLEWMHEVHSVHLCRLQCICMQVDNTSQTPEGPKWPSAVKALARARRPFGMLGAGHTGQCNPEGANYKVWAANRTPFSPYTIRNQSIRAQICTIIVSLRMHRTALLYLSARLLVCAAD